MKMKSFARTIDVVRRTALLGFKAFGGPAVHVILLRNEFVTSTRPWMDSTMFADLFALSSALPGPGSTQMLFALGLWRGGALAGFLAFFLFSLPGAIGMYLLSIGVARIPENLPDLALALLTGLNAASTGLIFYAGYVLTKACAKDGITVVILFGSAAFGTCFVFIWLYPVLTIAGGIITVAWDWPGWGRMKERRLKRKESQATPLEDIATLSTVTGSVPDKIEEDIEKSPVIESKETLPAVSPVVVADDATVDEEFPSQFSLTHWQAASVVGLWAAVFIIVLVLRSTLNNPTRALELFSNLYVAGTILFGGGPVVIPLLQSYTVDPGWVSTRDFLLGFAILQAFPGPNFNFAVYLGALALPNTSFLGALLGYLAIFTPGILFKFAVLPSYARFRTIAVIRSALRGLNAAAVGLIYVAVYRLFKVGALTNGTGTKSLQSADYWIVVAAAAFMASNSFGVQPWIVIICGALLGLFFGLAAGAP